MSSLIKQRKRYFLQFYDSGRTPSRKKVPLGVRLKQKARKLQSRLEALYAEGRYDPWLEDPKEALLRAEGRARPDEVPSLSGAVERFLKAKKAAGRAASTVRTYRHILTLFARETGEELHPAQLTPGRIRAFCHRADVAKATRRTRYKHVQAFVRWMGREGYLRKDPTESLEMPEAGERLPKAVRPEELREISEAIKRDYRSKRPEGTCRPGELLWLIGLFRFALYSGLRASELGRLKWKHLDLGRGLIFIYRQKNRREQTVPLVTKAREALPKERGPEAWVYAAPDAHERPRSPERFREYVSAAFRRYRDEAGLREEISFHGLRHGCASLLAEAGKSAVVIKEFLRHGSIETSMKYVHYAREHLRNEAEDAFS